MLDVCYCNSAYFVKTTPILLILCSYLSDILKICMKNFLDEKNILLTILQGLELSQFSFTLHIEQWHIVPTLLKMCMKIFLGEKINLKILKRFELGQFSFTLHIETWHIVPTL